MKKTFAILAALAAFTCLLPSCSCGSENESKAKHVFLIGLDGWGSYSVNDAEMPNVKALMAEGCYTLQKRAVLPSKSAVNWASMFMGVPTEVHGYIRWDSMDPDIPVYQQHIAKNGILPTIFQILRDQRPESEIGCIYEWDGIKYLIDTVAVNYHAMTPDYTVEENYGAFDVKLLLVTFAFQKFYFGGIEKDHGGFDLNEMETPFIIAGKNVKTTGEFAESMMQYDVAATIAEIFGLETPQVWTAKSMSHVFVD